MSKAHVEDNVVPEFTDDSRELFIRASKSGPVDRARIENQIVENHLGLARALASRFASRGPERDDLYQVAYLGLVKAVRRFDVSKGVPFVAFATPTILGELKRHFRDKGWMVRPPRWVQELQAQIRQTVDDLMQSRTVPPSDAELAELLDTKVARIREARGARGCYAPRSIDAPSGTTGISMGETLSVDSDAYALIDDLVSLGPACQELSEEDRRLLGLRFVEDRTQQAIAQELGISQMQVSRRLQRILDQLRMRMSTEAS